MDNFDSYVDNYVVYMYVYKDYYVVLCDIYGLGYKDRDCDVDD